MALSQTKEGRLQVCVLWDKQYETHIVRKSTLSFAKSQVLC